MCLGTVAHSNSVYTVRLHKPAYLKGGTMKVVLRRIGIDDLGVHEIALLVKTHDLAPGTKSRVNSQHARGRVYRPSSDRPSC